jgi:anti-anti-sigma factor
VPLSLRVDVDDDVAVVRVEGELDVTSVDALASTLALALTMGERGVALDLEECDFVSRHPLDTIWGAATFLRSRGQTFAVRRPPRSFSLLTELTCGRGA